MAALLRTFIISVVLVGIAAVTYLRLTSDEQARTIQELQRLNAEMEQRLAEREAMIQRLSRSRRLAHVQITNQKRDVAGVVIETSLLFIELNDQGSELARQNFTIPGDVLYVDAWTVKFDAERVAEGDPLRGKTMVLLRRIYSDRLAPRDGYLIDTPGAVPPGYAASQVGQFEKRVWENFWAIATDSKIAREMGVRVAQGEAVYKPVREGQTFELVVDAVGGMSLMPLAKDDAALTFGASAVGKP
jgi:hypothetical protein